ncbi:glycoside hydrolase family 3 N-terminal domain-containing protein [Eisenibacter elegans]|uniref:glycoside hydrolase family 3 N-terminal domain-containing protein n=1 Tax=Eisenibacter elegans TaxID=997 RepID=UPI0003F9FD09|nr:glycoside hydrolase family 3 N-terminal domain-containing protein [Eisenibacter elegans]
MMTRLFFSKQIWIFSISPVLVLVSFLTYRHLQPQPSAELSKAGTSFDFYTPPPPDSAFLAKRQAWVDSVFEAMTEEQRIGQLFMVAAYSDSTAEHERSVEALVREQHVGGVIFFKGGPMRQARLTNRYQAAAQVPLLVSIDAEWGLAMRLDSTMQFPYQMTLGAIQDVKLIYEMGRAIARQCRRIGIHINFAPVVDVNSNPQNPVIGFRSFGEDKEEVARRGVAYMQGLQREGVMANAKHFPGHGDTESDSHHTLPVIYHDTLRMKNLELYPFQKLMQHGLRSVMVAHLHIPAYDARQNRPTTLSSRVVTQLLQQELGFEGLIFTDALNMKGVSNYSKSWQIALQALLAGNDVLLFPDNVAQSIKQIQRSLNKGELEAAYLNHRVRKILSAKYDAGLAEYRPIDLQNLAQDLHPPEDQRLVQQLYEQALTLVKTKGNLLPLQRPDTMSLASVTIGNIESPEYQKLLSGYAYFKHYHINKNTMWGNYDYVLKQAVKSGTVVVSVLGTSRAATKQYGIPSYVYKFVEELGQQTNVILLLYGSPYTLKNFKNAQHVICAYEDTPQTRQAVPQALFGALPLEGQLPVSVGELKKGQNPRSPGLSRLRFDKPENVGLRTEVLEQLKPMIAEAIAGGEFPGCQVVVARKGAIVMREAFGHFTYAKTTPVGLYTLFDVASISKVAGTLQAVQYLYDRGQLDLDKPIVHYLPELKGTDKEDITLRLLLLHQAGLVPWIPFWKRTQDAQERFKPGYYATSASEAFPNQVAHELYSVKGIADTLWRWTVASERSPNPPGKARHKYVYSDLSFYMLQRVCEKLLDEKLDSFLTRTFYQPLGMRLTGYNPLQRFDRQLIMPTESDTYFRKQQVQGTVHDQGAALMGGVAGHAGLFSTATDLAVMMQMQLQKGYYGGHQYLKPTTVETFTRRQVPENFRGLGWDKPETDPISYMPARAKAPNGYGHSGFTGCVVWVDPDQELVFVFLSNRIYTDAENRKLINNHTRRKLIEKVYQALIPEQ